VFATFGGKPHAGQNLRLDDPRNRGAEKRELISRGPPYRLFRSGRVAKTHHCENVGYGDVDQMKRQPVLLGGSPLVH
jgi:hypothetical protein